MTEALNETFSVSELLQRCRRCPIRVSLFDPIYKDRLGRYPGILLEVFPDSLAIECLDMPPIVPPGTAATLELLQHGRLLWFHTRLQAGFAHQPHWLRLDWPESVQTTQQRRFPRTDTFLPVHYMLPGQAVPAKGVILDISEGGAALQGTEPLQAGQIISLVFALGSGLCFQDIKAEVLRAATARSGGWVAGLRFSGLSAEQVQSLSEWVSRRSREIQHKGDVK